MGEQELPQGIREATIERDDKGMITRVHAIFGPHHFLDLFVDETGATKFVVGATHHGFMADASVVWSELEQIVYEVREKRPGTAVD